MRWLLVTVGILALWATRDAQAATLAPSPYTWPDLDASGVYNPMWNYPDNAEPYLSVFANAEYQYDIPVGLLSRVAYQESRFRDDIISGELKSSAGAVGLMQIVPRWHPNVDPTNPIESIYYAAEYLKRLYNQFGTWAEALAAYNWGPGNLARKGMSAAPDKTINYVAQISADVSLS